MVNKEIVKKATKSVTFTLLFGLAEIVKKEVLKKSCQNPYIDYALWFNGKG